MFCYVSGRWQLLRLSPRRSSMVMILLLKPTLLLHFWAKATSLWSADDQLMISWRSAGDPSLISWWWTLGQAVLLSLMSSSTGWCICLEALGPNCDSVRLCPLSLIWNQLNAGTSVSLSTCLSRVSSFEELMDVAVRLNVLCTDVHVERALNWLPVKTCPTCCWCLLPW